MNSNKMIYNKKGEANNAKSKNMLDNLKSLYILKKLFHYLSKKFELKIFMIILHKLYIK